MKRKLEQSRDVPRPFIVVWWVLKPIQQIINIRNSKIKMNGFKLFKIKFKGDVK